MFTLLSELNARYHLKDAFFNLNFFLAYNEILGDNSLYMKKKLLYTHTVDGEEVGDEIRV